MFEGNGDNPGPEMIRIQRCGSACHNKQKALSGSWSGFKAKGFIVYPTSGRCYCESADSKSCTRHSNGYDRYDFKGASDMTKRLLAHRSSAGIDRQAVSASTYYYKQGKGTKCPAGENVRTVADCKEA